MQSRTVSAFQTTQKSYDSITENSNNQDASQIFKFDEDTKKIIFYEDRLQLLKRDEIKDCKVCVISINGSYRTGKSFLLNFFLHYLRNKCENVEEWMDVDDTLTPGFLWKTTSKRVTDGIFICPEIFLTKTKKGEQIAIILMDTQGTSDHRASDTECSKIFALSALISSVQIYNLQKKLNSDDLKMLQLFTGYGAMFSESGHKPFQDLLILIRDWIYPYEFNFGFEGGKKLLNSAFKDHKKSNLSEIQQIFQENFQNTRCFLMPNPKEKVETEAFKGHFNDMGEEFRDCVKTFVDHLLRPENLVPKKIDGHFVKVKDLVTFISTYCKHINTETQLSVKTIYMASAEIFLQRRIDRTVEEYKKFLRSENRTQIDVKKSKILKDFGRAREMKLATKELQESFKQQLTKLLDAVCNDFLTLLNQEDDLGKEYIQYIKECKTLKSAEEMKMTILVKFQKRTGNSNCDEELRKKSKQRLTGLIDKMYENFHTLFDLMNQLTEEYIESVKECRTLEQAQTQIKNILEKLKKKSENVNCNEDFRDNFKARLNALLDKVHNDFRALLNQEDDLGKEYIQYIKECRTLKSAEKMKMTILVKFQKGTGNLNCDEELRKKSKQRLTGLIDKMYKNFHTLFDLMNQLIEEYTESVKECRTLEQAQTQIKNILEKFKKESENVNCDEEFRDNFKARLNAPLHQMCENFYTLFINVKKLEQEYNNSISNCNTLQHAEEAKNEILDKFEKNVNANSDCEEELRDIFKQRLTDNCEQIYKNNEADIIKRELVDSALTAAKCVGGAMVAASHTCPPLAAAGSGLVALATLTESIIKKKREQ